MVNAISNKPVIIQPKENKTNVAKKTLGAGALGTTAYGASIFEGFKKDYATRLAEATEAYQKSGVKGTVKKADFIKNQIKSAKINDVVKFASKAAILVFGALAAGTLIDAGINAIKNRKK